MFLSALKVYLGVFRRSWAHFRYGENTVGIGLKCGADFYLGADWSAFEARRRGLVAFLRRVA